MAFPFYLPCSSSTVESAQPRSGFYGGRKDLSAGAGLYPSSWAGAAEVGWENSSGKESPEGLISFKRDLRNMGSLGHGSRSAQLSWPWQCPLFVSRVVAGQNEPRELTASFSSFSFQMHRHNDRVSDKVELAFMGTL